jgi:arginine:agmatine antiporter
VSAAPARKLGPWLAAMLVAGNMIGSGIYGLPATLGAIGSVSILGWIAATLGAFGVAAVFASLSRVSRSLDGVVGYAGEGLGRFWGFAMAIVYWMGLWVGNASIAVVLITYLSKFLPALESPLGRTLGTVSAIWVATGLNLIGPRWVARFGELTLAAGLIPVVAVATAGWFWFNPHTFTASWNVSGQDGFQAMQSSMVAAYWAYLGVESAAVVAAVVREPERNVPFATYVGIGIAAAVYLSAATVLMGLAPAREYAQSQAPLALAFGKMAGPTAALIVAACAVLKISGTLGGWVLMTAETARAGADVHLFPGKLAPERRDQIPRRILFFMAVLMTGAALASNSPTFGKQFGVLLDVSTVWCIIPYVVCAFALLRLSGRPASAGGRWGARGAALVAIAFTGWTISTGTAVTLWLTLALAVVTVILWIAIGMRARRTATA